MLSDDDEEIYVDLKIDDEGNVKPKKRKKNAAVAGWFHAKVETASATVDVETEVKEEVDSKVLDKELAAKIQLKKTINLDKVNIVSESSYWWGRSR